MVDRGGHGQALVPALLLGSVGLLVLGVQPLLFAAYLRAGLIDEAGLGTLAAAEISAIAMGSVAGVRWLRNRSPRTLGFIGLAWLVIGNFLPFVLPLFIIRACTGFGAGLLVAIAATQIARCRNVNAASGLFLFLQATSQYALMQAISLYAPESAASSIQQALAVLAAAAVPLLLWTAASVTADPGAAMVARPVAAGYAALGVCALFVGASVGIWAYLGVWLESRAVPAVTAAAMLSATLAGQIAGTLAAIGLGTHRHSGWQVALAGLAIVLLVSALLIAGATGALGWALLVGFGFVWMIGTPALSGLVLACDPGRGSLAYAASAQLLGAALVPTLVGEALAAHGLDLALAAFALTAAMATLIVPLCLWRRQALPGRPGRRA